MSETKRIEHNKFLENTPLKVLGIVGMCILEVLIVGAVLLAVWSAALKNHSVSELIREQMGNNVFDLVSALSEDNPTQTDPSQTNLRFHVEQVSSDGEKELLLDTTDNESILQKEDFWLCIKSGTGSPWLATEEDRGTKQRRVERSQSIFLHGLSRDAIYHERQDFLYLEDGGICRKIWILCNPCSCLLCSASSPDPGV